MVGPHRPPDLDPQLPKIRLPDQYVSLRNLCIKLPDLRIQAPDLSLQNPYISLRILSIKLLLGEVGEWLRRMVVWRLGSGGWRLTSGSFVERILDIEGGRVRGWERSRIGEEQSGRPPGRAHSRTLSFFLFCLQM